MGFRRNGKQANAARRVWQTWLGAHDDLARASGLPISVLRSEEDWRYLLRYGYHCGEQPYGRYINKVEFQ